MLTNDHQMWTDLYRQAALEVDGRKMPERILAAQQAITKRQRDLESSANHHAERHEIEYALKALSVLEREARAWQ